MTGSRSYIVKKRFNPRILLDTAGNGEKGECKTFCVFKIDLLKPDLKK